MSSSCSSGFGVDFGEPCFLCELRPISFCLRKSGKRVEFKTNMSHIKEIDSLKAKRDGLEVQLTMKGLDKERELAIQQRIIATTQEITSYVGHLRVERFTQEWFANGTEQVFWSCTTGGSMYLFSKMWGLPTVQARVVGITTGFLRLMYGTAGLQNK